MKTTDKKIVTPKLSRSGLPMKELDKFAKEIARNSQQNAKIIEEMFKAGFKPI